MNTEVFTKMLAQIKDFISSEILKINKRFDALPEAEKYNDSEIKTELKTIHTLIIKEVGSLNLELSEKNEQIISCQKTITELQGALKLIADSTSKSNESLIVKLGVLDNKYSELNKDLSESLAELSNSTNDVLDKMLVPLAELDEKLDKRFEKTTESLELKILSKININSEEIKETRLELYVELDNKLKSTELQLSGFVKDGLLSIDDKIVTRMDALKGKDGSDGEQGKAGLNGVNGKDGSAGLNGKDGLTFEIEYFDQVEKDKTYNKHDSVLFNDKRYVSTCDNNSDGIPSPKWKLLIPSGRQGKQGVQGEKA